MIPEPMHVVGGPFDFKVSRRKDTITMSVVGDKGDLITAIDFPAYRVNHVIDALVEASAL